MTDDTFFITAATILARAVTVICLTIIVWNIVPATERVLTRWIEVTND